MGRVFYLPEGEIMKELKFLSSGGALNLDMGSNCGFLKHKKNLLLIDCCEDAAKKLLKLNLFNGVENFYLALTHMHFDHTAGIGTLIWYCTFVLNLKIKIIINSNKFKKNLIKFLKLGGVDVGFVEFVKQSDFRFDDLTLKMLKTEHAQGLECYGIMFKDCDGEYYYTGDTKDLKTIQKFITQESVKKIYCEVSDYGYGSHLCYEDLKKLNKEKLIFMHFNSIELYKTIVKDGFKVAKVEKEKICKTK